MITKIIYDIRKNLKINIDLQPSQDGIEYGMSTKFYPTGATENFIYSTRNIIQENYLPEDQLLREMQYLESAPPPFINSLLSSSVSKVTENPLSSITRVLVGAIPNITAAIYLPIMKESILDQLGILAETDKYTEKINAVINDIPEPSGFPEIQAIQKQKSFVNFKPYASGNSLATISEYNKIETTMADTTSDEPIISTMKTAGYQYISGDFDVDYYNKIIIPLETETVSDNLKSTITALSNFAGNPELGVIERNSHINKNTTIENNKYLYQGSSPLPTEQTKTVTIEGDHLINIENYRVVALLQPKTEKISEFVIITSGYPRTATYKELLQTKYYRNVVDSVNFYRPQIMSKAKSEQVITGHFVEVQTDIEVETFYPITKGSGKWGELSYLQHGLGMDTQEKIFESSKLLGGVIDIGDIQNTYAGYTIAQGTEVYDFFEYTKRAGINAVVDFTNELECKIETKTTQSSNTTIQPVGKNLSIRHIVSEKISPLSKDVDTQTFKGGGVQLKTFTWPTKKVKVSYGYGTTPKSINLESFVFYSESDIRLVAKNFNYLLDTIGTISLNFRGIASPSDISQFLGSNSYLIDKISYDFGQNTTTFECRGEIF